MKRLANIRCNIFFPIFRFSQVLQHLIAPDQETTHVAEKKRSIDNATEYSKRRLKLKTINHQCAGWMRDELMIVFHALERTRYHDVLKSERVIESSNSDSESLLDPEMPSLPSYLVTHPNQAVGHACNCPLMCAFS